MVMSKQRFFGKNVDMTEGVVWQKLLLFALPLILGDFLQQLYSTVDSIIVGNYVGKTALAAVTSTETLINSIIGLFSGVSLGGTIVIARYFGAKDEENVSRSVHTTMTIALLMGVLMMAVGISLSPALLRILKTPDDVFDEARQYLTIYFSGMIGLVAYNMSGGILRAVGDSVRPLIALVITSVVNIILDLVFVVTFKMGVAGAAYATIIAIYISAAYLLVILMRAAGPYRFSFKKLCYNKNLAHMIYSIGVPNGIQKSVVAFANLFVISHINLFGSGASAGWGVFRKIDTVVMNVISNIGQAASTFVSQNIGARRPERIKKGTRFSVVFCLAVCIIMDALLLIFREPIIKLFTDDADVLYYGSLAFATALFFQPANAVAHTVAGVIRGFGDGKGPSYITILCMVVLRQIYLNALWSRYPSFIFAVSCYPFAWLLNCLFVVLYYFYRKKKGFFKIPS